MKGFLEKRNYGDNMFNDNSFMNELKERDNYTTTENGATAHKSTLNKVYDMFAFGGAYRGRSNEDCILLFKQALEENQDLAMKCLFYLRDIRGGQGERRFFRVCFNWLAKEYPDLAKRNLSNLAEYGRYDDLYCVVDTPIEKDMFALVDTQIKADLASMSESPKAGVSLLAKWLKSENASSKETKMLGNKTREALGLTHKKYRELLSAIRTRINIVEKLMSERRYNEIEYSKIPSQAGFKYKNAFAKRDAERYKAFLDSKEAKVNTAAMFPYEIVRDARKLLPAWYDATAPIDEDGRKAVNKYWANLKDYFNGKPCKILPVIDTSGSMTSGHGSVAPIDVAISLGIYAAERMSGPFAGHYISFASRPQLIEVSGVDFVDKVKRIYDTNLVDDTNLEEVFKLLKDIALSDNVNPDDMPDTIPVISDMEINQGSYWHNEYTRQAEMEKIRKDWEAAGLTMPKLVYWNVDARHNIILEDAKTEGISYVSGCSPVIFEAILTGKTGIDLMLEKLNSDRYSQVK